MNQTRKHITIFEGPDGSGKTTAAKAFAVATGAKYVHFPAYPEVTVGLAKLYIEAVLPALQGYQGVVLDRCWLSEVPYGKAFRGGLDRLGPIQKRTLERIVMTCGAVVVRCQPKWATVMANYHSRRHLEMLDTPEQLDSVYLSYLDMETHLPIINWDYEKEAFFPYGKVRRARNTIHRLTSVTAGNFRASNFILVDSRNDKKGNFDPLYNWPLSSFQPGSTNYRVTNTFISMEIPESDLFWVDLDQDLRAVKYDIWPRKKFYALDGEGLQKLASLGISGEILSLGDSV